MHARIFQLSTRPINKNNHLLPAELYENSESFADYIGDRLINKERENAIEAMVNTLSEVFDYDGKNLIYKGCDKFMQDWMNDIKNKAKSLDWSSNTFFTDIYRLGRLLHETHRESASRFYIEEWNGWAGPASDLIDFVSKHLKIGDKLYIGAVIDYHF